MLEVSNLSKVYPAPSGQLSVLSNVSIAMQRGESASIMGPSGSGKSTLLYILGALESPTSGQVFLDGDDPFTLEPRALAEFRNRAIGFVFQDHLLLPQCNVLENVLLPTLVGNPLPDGHARARDLLDRVGLSERLNYRPAELSGGEKQRVALARALIRHPPLVLCDEPTGNLDPDNTQRIMDLLFEQVADATVVMVTHDHSLADRFDAVMDFGELQT